MAGRLGQGKSGRNGRTKKARKREERKRGGSMETAPTLFVHPCAQNASLFFTNTNKKRTCGFFTQMDFLKPA